MTNNMYFDTFCEIKTVPDVKNICFLNIEFVKEPFLTKK